VTVWNRSPDRARPLADAGARIATYLTGAVQLSLLAVIMLAAAISMFANARRSGSGLAEVANAERPASLQLLLPVALCVSDSRVRHRSGLVEAIQRGQRPTTEVMSQPETHVLRRSESYCRIEMR